MQREMVHEQGGGNHHHHHQLPRFGNGNGGAATTGVARASKKSKTKKIPQRGLGVAQLEKLRIEEQKKMEGAAATAMSSVPGGAAAHLGGGLGHLLPPMHPPPLSLGALPRPGGADGVHCGYPPVLWDPSAAVADPMKHPFKRSHMCPQPPLPTVSTGLSLTAPSSHPSEPPSNQMYSCSSLIRTSAAAPAPADGDREAAGVDRSWPYVFEGLNTTAFRTTMGGKAPFAARTTRETSAGAGGLPDVCPDLSRYEFRATNYFSSSNASCSDCWSSEFGHCKKMSSKENEAAYLTLNAQAQLTPRMKQQQQPPPALPSIHLPPLLPEFGDFGVMQSQHGSASASSASASRPFYSFMPVGPVRCERPLSEIKADASDGVDLELKL